MIEGTWLPKPPKIGSKSAIFTPAPLQAGGLRPSHIGSGQTAHPRPRIARAALDRIGKDRNQQRGLARRQRRRRLAKGVDGPSLRAELAYGAELGDAEIDLQNPLLCH